MEFILYFARLALPLNLKSKVGCTSELKMNGIHFVLRSACTTFAFVNKITSIWEKLFIF